ncbi:MAG: dipeptidyl aminopeptidase/acylaminoacyl peptidase [Candidatus Latescibacterota bacterium]|jgi:dipeptidyl aminopeptidase/acylaminoacyl peptidase
MKQKLPYGTWPSSISAERVALAARRFGQVQVDRGMVYWVETRPDEGGRSVLMRSDAHGQVFDVVPHDFNVRTRVHEYGGVAYVVHEGVVFCSCGDDGRVYRVVEGAAPVAITPEENARYADFSISNDGQAVFCVRERHDVGVEPINDVVCLIDGKVAVLAEGNDFYAAPRLSGDGRQLAWLTWQHPNMPWDGTELWLADWTDGQTKKPRCIAGDQEDAIFQPTWGQDGCLYFVSDRTGWWNLYSWDSGNTALLWEKEAEFGQPLWSLGMTTFAETHSEQWVCTYIELGFAKLGVLGLPAQDTRFIELPFSDYSGLSAQGNTVAFIAGDWNKTLAVIRLDISTGEYKVLRENEEQIEADTLSRPEAITFPSLDGETVHAFYYPPRNGTVEGVDHEKPPLLVKSHGGPTGASTPTLDLSIQYWTSRGFAVLDVNYRGSTGYGRAYRRALDGQWGVYDVQDCVAGAQYLAANNQADGSRLLIRGGSAGGLTTLCALAFYDVFHAGASLYGVSDLASLAKITHKFESQYLNRLIGGEDLEATFRERSPLYRANHISAPVIFFQGKEDPVVPPIQTQTMADALLQNGIPVACVMFDGEMHGFRKAENIIYALNGEYAFYAAIFGLDCQEELPNIRIDNWPPS